MLYAIIGMLVIIMDQGVKYWVTSNLMVDSVTQPLIPGVLSLVRLHNDGAAFSFLAGGGARIYFIILTAIFTVAVIIALATNFINGRFGRWCLVLVTAGGLSNCLDRVLYGYVVDMFKIDLFDFAVFNVADVFITIFAILFIVYIIFGGEDKHEDEDDFAEDDEEGTSHEPLNVSFKKLRNSAETEREDRRARTARERAAEVKTNKYREETDEVSSPRFSRGNANSAAARQTGAKQRTEDNSPAARRERTLEGFGHQTASTGNARPTAARPAAQAQTERRAKPQKTLYEQDYEQYKAEHPELENSQPVRKKATASSAPTYDSSDPFAAWESASARVGARQSSTAKAMGVDTAASQPRTATTKATVDAVNVAPAQAKPTQSAAAPVEKATAPKPAAAPKASADDDFDLDAILNEFK